MLPATAGTAFKYSYEKHGHACNEGSACRQTGFVCVAAGNALKRTFSFRGLFRETFTQPGV